MGNDDDNNGDANNDDNDVKDDVNDDNNDSYSNNHENNDIKNDNDELLIWDSESALDIFGCLQYLAIILLDFLKFGVLITTHEIYYENSFSKMFQIFSKGVIFTSKKWQYNFEARFLFNWKLLVTNIG